MKNRVSCGKVDGLLIDKTSVERHDLNKKVLAIKYAEAITVSCKKA